MSIPNMKNITWITCVPLSQNLYTWVMFPSIVCCIKLCLHQFWTLHLLCLITTFSSLRECVLLSRILYCEYGFVDSATHVMISLILKFQDSKLWTSTGVSWKCWCDGRQINLLYSIIASIYIVRLISWLNHRKNVIILFTVILHSRFS
jgi:hypothetical protein